MFSPERKQANAAIKEAEKDLQNANPGVSGQLQALQSGTCPGMEAARTL